MLIASLLSIGLGRCNGEGVGGAEDEESDWLDEYVAKNAQKEEDAKMK